jgi:hypothetical protein
MATDIDLGQLLRLRAMTTKVLQTQVTEHAGIALVHAYNGLREEMLGIHRQGLAELREEFARLLPSLDEPPAYDPSYRMPQPEFLVAATEAMVKLGQLEGWIQGLIDEQTLEERMRLEAEAKAKLATRPSTGFAAPDQA